jgi:hypothetical protein
MNTMTDYEKIRASRNAPIDERLALHAELYALNKMAAISVDCTADEADADDDPYKKQFSDLMQELNFLLRCWSLSKVLHRYEELRRNVLRLTNVNPYFDAATSGSILRVAERQVFEVKCYFGEVVKRDIPDHFQDLRMGR